MSSCCTSKQCQGVEQLFDRKTADSDLADYLQNGAEKTTMLLLDQLKKSGFTGKSLLDIGGGIGAIQLEGLAGGLSAVTNVDASTAYSTVAQEEAIKRGVADKVTYLRGDFVQMAGEVKSADIVTLDRVICCYDDMPKLVGAASQKATQAMGVVFPVDRGVFKIGRFLLNAGMSLFRHPYRFFLHSTDEVIQIAKLNGLKPTFHKKHFLWQVLIFERI